MTSEKCINIIKEKLIKLVDSGKLNATYKPSVGTISFYVDDICVQERPLLTLRLSDHNPKYQNYVRPYLTPPSEGYNVNVSIEFYRPKYKVDGSKERNRVDTRVKVPQGVHGVVPFVVNSYDYTPEKLEEEDIEKIYDAILSWIYGGLNAEYKDPFANTDKAAKVKSKVANITWNIALNISVDKDGNYVSANGCGADFIPENKNINYNRKMNKKLIRLTESDLHKIVRESVNRVLNEELNQFNDSDFGGDGNPLGLENEYEEEDNLDGFYGTFNNISVKIVGDGKPNAMIMVAAKRSGDKRQFVGAKAQKLLDKIRNDIGKYNSTNTAIYQNLYQFVL